VLFEIQPGVPVREWFRWAPERGLRFGVKQRRAGGTVRWFDAPTPGFIFPPGNAYEDGSRIAMDACTYLDGGGLLESLRTFRAGNLGPGGKAVPFLYEIDLETGRCSERQLDERGAEFPRLDDRRVGYPNRYGYAVMGDGGAVGPGPKSIVRYDRHGGRSQRHDLPPGHYPGEPIFVPRRPDAAEDDGFVLAVVFDGEARRSYLAIFDAQNVEREPLARLHLRGRVPMGFHGNYAAGVV
jgi:carotenoid cleavage dioxygenase